MAKIQVEIANRPTPNGHKIVKIIKNGRVYACHYAEPFPTFEKALADYKADPKAFVPFNETTGQYIY